MNPYYVTSIMPYLDNQIIIRDNKSLININLYLYYFRINFGKLFLRTKHGAKSHKNYRFFAIISTGAILPIFRFFIMFPIFCGKSSIIK